MSVASDHRNPVVLADAIKALAAQLIVLHHLAWYGPMSYAAAQLMPAFDLWQNWLADYGRYAVAAFLAVGGYLTAHSLGMQGLAAGRSPAALILQRYWRLVAPFAIALFIAIACAAAARHWMPMDFVGAPAKTRQLLAHMFLLHGLLGIDSLSAGVWYVAIDFQLYALMVCLLWLAGRLSQSPARLGFLIPGAVALVGFASLIYFNRDPRWDNTALYFFGAYALGALACWSVRLPRPHVGLLLLAGVTMAALAIDYRPRIAIALGVSIALAIGQLYWQRVRDFKWLSRLSQTSYALFLVHFPICLLVSAVFYHYFPGSPLPNLFGLFLAWVVSNMAAFLFHRQVERSLLPWLTDWANATALRIRGFQA